MTLAVAEERAATNPRVSERANALTRLRVADGSFRAITFSAAVFVLLILVGVLVSLFIGAWPAFRAFGFGFLTSDVWSAPKQQFGAASAIYGTIVTALIAMLIGVPVGLG